jgi:type IV pilus assembly protein PilF
MGLRWGRPAVVILLGLALGGCAAMAEREVTGERAEAAEVNAELGIGYLREGEVDQAERNLKRALEFDPNHPLANLGMANVYERRGALDRAEEHYRRALRRDDGNPYVQTSLGALLCRREAFDEAQELFARAIDNPDYDQREIALMNSGVCFADAGQTERAEEKLREALRINPQYPRALLEMASLTYEDDRPMQTRAFLQRLEGLGVESSETLFLCYRAELALGNRRAANDCAERLRRQYPDSMELVRLEDMERNGG